MSFSKNIKKEIANSEIKKCCAIAELAAFVVEYGNIKISGGKTSLLLKSENPVATKRFKVLFKNILNLESSQTMLKKTNLKKNVIYENEINHDINAIYEKLGLYSSSRGYLDFPSYKVIKKDCCAKSYLKILFLTRGSCNKPESKSYHLEISVDKESVADFALKLMKRFNLDAKITKRNNSYVVYLKKSEQISDFLALIGASVSMLRLEEVRMQKDLLHNCIRINNCDIANEIKSLKNAQEQLDDIKQLLKFKKIEDIDDKLVKVINLRLKYPEHSLKELIAEYETTYNENISKSGIRHRFNRIKEISRS